MGDVAGRYEATGVCKKAAWEGPGFFLALVFLFMPAARLWALELSRFVIFGGLSFLSRVGVKSYAGKPLANR